MVAWDYQIDQTLHLAVQDAALRSLHLPEVLDCLLVLYLGMSRSLFLCYFCHDLLVAHWRGTERASEELWRWRIFDFCPCPTKFESDFSSRVSMQLRVLRHLVPALSPASRDL